MIIEEIIELARWAPSGDNTQPWRFEIVDDKHMVVHGFDTRKDCVYDFRGHGSHLAHGALLESISLAASGHGLKANISYRTESHAEHPLFDVIFTEEPNLHPDPLLLFIRDRSVQRRPYSTRSLTHDEKKTLTASVEPLYQIEWLEGLPLKLQMAKLLSRAGKLRLSIPEAYEVHRKIIQWDAQYSEDRVPDQAIGIDKITLRLMRWVMKSWHRVDFFNTFLAGSLVPRIELDIIPAVACAAHFFIIAKDKPDSIMDYIQAGRVLQRFWLSATKLNLQLQPEMSPLIFRNYHFNGVPVSIKKGADQAASEIAQKLNSLVKNTDAGKEIVFMGRIGSGRKSSARSVRLPLERLKQITQSS